MSGLAGNSNRVAVLILSDWKTKVSLVSTALALSPLLLLTLSFGSLSVGEGRKEMRIAGLVAICVTEHLSPYTWVSLVQYFDRFVFLPLANRMTGRRSNFCKIKLKISWFRQHSELLTLNQLSQSAFWFTSFFIWITFREGRVFSAQFHYLCHFCMYSCALCSF